MIDHHQISDALASPRRKLNVKLLQHQRGKSTWARFSKNLALVLSTSDVMIDLSERSINPEIGNCDLFSDSRRKTCYERGTISITYSNRLSIFPLQTDSNRYPCEFAFPIRRWRKDARSRPL